MERLKEIHLEGMKPQKTFVELVMPDDFLGQLKNIQRTMRLKIMDTEDPEEKQTEREKAFGKIMRAFPANTALGLRCSELLEMPAGDYINRPGLVVNGEVDFVKSISCSHFDESICFEFNIPEPEDSITVFVPIESVDELRVYNTHFSSN